MHYIIKNGDNLSKLSRIYNAVESEIIENNPHIRDFENLQPGMKISIPVNNDNTKSEIGYVKPFIENYYKKNEILGEPGGKEYQEKNIEEKNIEEKNIEEKKEKDDKKVNKYNDKVFVDYSNIYYDSRTDKYYYKVRPK